MISQKEFVTLDHTSLKLNVAGFEKYLVRKSDYFIEVGITQGGQSKFYKITLKSRSLKPIDIVLKKQFINLKFPELPTKKSITADISKEQAKSNYLKALLNQIVEYGQSHNVLKQQLYAVLYNFLFKEKVEQIKSLSDLGSGSSLSTSQSFIKFEA